MLRNWICKNGTKYGEHTVNFDAVSARYVKFQGVKRAMNYGYSMWEFKVIAK
ncbi:hypothetical protein [uncultured Eubacterium sp.]|uniref:hypothetical protein n=1 Tax=uncultured Eubacterium sp. TaxID=165185 RepID=UPI0025971184|nr:hypothetical protein [uncultured Eubacterium sp.]